MAYKFKKVGLIGRANRPEIIETLKITQEFFLKNNVPALIDKDTSKLIADPKFPIVNRDDIGKQCDLAVVVGGDGSILRAAKTLAAYNVSVIGIHRGRLGFLTDIAPDAIDNKLTKILHGEYVRHELCLLHADIIDTSNNNKVKTTLDAVNEVVLNSGNITRMIEFEVYTDNQFVYQQRSDGLIVATPTGSTAYALSGGGPILTPKIKALVLVPMFPHNLTSRSVVIPDTSRITIKPIHNNKLYPGVSCDGQAIELLNRHDTVEIYKSDKILHLLHPKDYNYYETLRTKLHWSTKPA